VTETNNRNEYHVEFDEALFARNPIEVDRMVQRNQAMTKTHEVLIGILSSSHHEDIRRRKSYGSKLLWTLIIQLGVLNLIFIMMGFGWLNYSENVLYLFISLTFGEILAVVYFIVKYLYSSDYRIRTADIIKLLKRWD
jgi:hypothetical protein